MWYYIVTVSKKSLSGIYTFVRDNRGVGGEKQVKEPNIPTCDLKSDDETERLCFYLHKRTHVSL